MRLSLPLRFILPLVAVLGLMAAGLVPLTERLATRWFTRDLDTRSDLVANTIESSLRALSREVSDEKILAVFVGLSEQQRLYALGLCDSSGPVRFQTSTFPKELQCATLDTKRSAHTLQLADGSVYVAIRPIREHGRGSRLVLVHDMSFVDKRSADTKRFVFWMFVGIAVVVSFITVFIAHLSWQGWLHGVRSIFKHGGFLKSMIHARLPELRPIAKEFRALVKEIETTRQVRDESQISWNPAALKAILQQELAGEEVLIVSNRQPYIHNRNKNGEIEVQMPASGLVTALEPVMRACSGTWIAHGSGSADKDVVDAFDRVRVPPNNPEYSIRRVWLSPEEEEGYYYGFANEGLWPLCHIAHTRPLFRSSDWKYYEQVNQRFAEAVAKEAKTKNPVILVQDYHFALLPRMIRELIPDATIITFWHIPWPNAEAFGICPWRDEIIRGLLGSSIIGFHTRFHCNNFLETVDRYVEARIDRETSTVSCDNELSAVHHYPISIEWPARWIKKGRTIDESRKAIRRANELPENALVAVGVDRLDYTKGIVERFLAVERLFELKPEWVGRFSLVQIAAPSRSILEEYKRLDKQVRELADRINTKYGTRGYQPICLRIQHHSAEEVFEYFRGSDLCVVSSLHDGMNLVAKEFIAARDDLRGVLILSQFTGAARELPEALIINPYDIDQCAAALHVALRMPLHEQAERMKNMRALVQEFNVYRWAGKMLTDAARVRQKKKYTRKHWMEFGI